MKVLQSLSIGICAFAHSLAPPLSVTSAQSLFLVWSVLWLCFYHNITQCPCQSAGALSLPTLFVCLLSMSCAAQPSSTAHTQAQAPRLPSVSAGASSYVVPRLSPSGHEPEARRACPPPGRAARRGVGFAGCTCQGVGLHFSPKELSG